MGGTFWGSKWFVVVTNLWGYPGKNNPSIAFISITLKKFDSNLKEMDGIPQELKNILKKFDSNLKEMDDIPKELQSLLKKCDSNLKEMYDNSKDLEIILKKFDSNLKGIDDIPKELDSILKKVDSNLWSVFVAINTHIHVCVRTHSGRTDYSIRATTSDYQQCGILTSVDSGKPVQPPFRLRNSK